MDTKYRDDEIDLIELFYVLKSKLVWIIVVGLVFAGVTYTYCEYFATPTYKAASKIYVLTTSTSITQMADIQLSSELTTDYAELITSRPVALEVNSNLELGMKYEDIVKLVSVSNPADTRLMVIEATSTDPKLAKDIANEFATVSKKQIARIMQTDEPTIAEAAVLPTKQASPDVTKDMLIAFLIGVILMALIFSIKHITNDKVVNQDDIEKYLGLTVLATIPLQKKVTYHENKPKEDSEGLNNASKTGEVK